MARNQVSLALLVPEQEAPRWNERRLALGLSTSLSKLVTTAVEELLSLTNPAMALRDILDGRCAGQQAGRRPQGLLVNVAIPSATYQKLRVHVKACRTTAGEAVLALMARPTQISDEVARLREELLQYRALYGDLSSATRNEKVAAQ